MEQATHRGQPSRRAVVGGAIGVLLSSRAHAEAAPPSGAVGLICSPAGIAGLLMDGEEGRTLDPAFRWHIGSNTKALTAALYARLVDSGQCRWGASVPALFPSLRVHPAWADRRIEDLLSHAAGLTDRLVDPAWLGERHADRTLAPAQRRLLAQRILAVPPEGPRGAYRYGNLNYVLVGAAIEEATATSWEEAMRSRLFAALGMRESGFGAPPRAGLWGREGSGATARPVDPAGLADNPQVLWPSGGVHLTPADYACFLSLFLRGGAPYLRSATLDHLLAPSAPGIPYAGGWSLAGPSAQPAQRLTHNGSNTLWFATALVDRGRGRGYAAITNRGGEDGEATTSRLLAALQATDTRSDGGT